MKLVGRDLKSDINKATRSTMGPEWKKLVEANATSRMDSRVLAKGAGIRAGNPPTAVAATSRRRLSGGLVPQDTWAPFEFGANRNKVTTYTRKSRNGGTHKVSRHTARQLPRRNPRGRVAFEAAREVVPRMAALWTQLIYKKVYDALEGG